MVGVGNIVKLNLNTFNTINMADMGDSNKPKNNTPSLHNTMAQPPKSYAVVTGSNKGIGLEICKQLALTNGIVVVLTARDEKKGQEAVEKLKKECGLSDHHLLFHQLDVVNPQSVASLADFIKTKFGKLDILVNNAGIGGSVVDAIALKEASSNPGGSNINWNEILKEPYELAKECLETNYYGPKRMVEAFIPLLQLSDSPRIVNISSTMGQLRNITYGLVKEVFSDVERLREERVDAALTKFLEDFKEGVVQKAGTGNPYAYRISKAALNAYTRIVAKKYPSMCINCVCPGYVKTDLNYNTGTVSVEEGAANPVRLALLPSGGPSGVFFVRKEESSFD